MVGGASVQHGQRSTEMSTTRFEKTWRFALMWTLFQATALCQPPDRPNPSPGSSAEILTVERIFKKHEFRAENFQSKWLDDQAAYEILKTERETEFQSIVRYSMNEPEKGIQLLDSEWFKPAPEAKPLKVASYAWSSDHSRLLFMTNTRRVWRLHTRGDFWVLDMKTRRLHQIGKSLPASTLMFAKFSPNGQRVAYVCQGNLYVEEVAKSQSTASGPIQLTRSASDAITNGTFDWVYEEEFSLRDGFRFSPDGLSIAFWEIDSSGIEPFTLVDNTTALYPIVQKIPYPKVGTINPAARIGVIDLASQSIRWVSIPGNPRDHYLARMEWMPNSRNLVIQQLNRLQNENRVYVVNVDSDSAKIALTESDPAWVDVHDEMFWLADGKRFTWLSERSGWRQIELVDSETGARRPITPTGVDVIQALGVNEKEGYVYYTASPDNPAASRLYRSPVKAEAANDSENSSNIQHSLSPQMSGTYRYQCSSNCQYAIATYSNANHPPQVELIRMSDHSRIRTLESNSSLREKLAPMNLPQFEFFRVPVGENVELDAWSLMPSGFDQQKRYPLIVYVYGEPAGQTVLDVWGGERSMWLRMLAQQGFVVMSFDNRGTPAPRGRTWRKSVYRQIGILASSDQASAVRSVLASRPYLDPERVGVWGWSGGGSMTLNGLFRYPDLYAAGVSIAPVPNQLYYDTIYQERYMGLPQDNAAGYRDGSPIAHARNLKGQLLLIHGTGDDNCHYQTTELLINELIRHNKQFKMFAYPGRSHAISEGDNTTPHLYQQLTDHFLQHLR